LDVYFDKLTWQRWAARNGVKELGGAQIRCGRNPAKKLIANIARFLALWR
jgi:hypothetical protein